MTKTKRWRADLLDGLLKLASGFVGRLQAQEAIEPPVQVAVVDFEGAVGQRVAPPSDGAGALQQALQARREQASPSSMTYCASRIRWARQN